MHSGCRNQSGGKFSGSQTLSTWLHSLTHCGLMSQIQEFTFMLAFPTAMSSSEKQQSCNVNSAVKNVKGYGTRMETRYGIKEKCKYTYMNFPRYCYSNQVRVINTHTS